MTLFRTYDEQIEILKSRGMIIDDEPLAKDILARRNYYNLINGYKDGFISQISPEKYIEGTKFEHFVALYDFDEWLRNAFFRIIIKIEKEIKAIIAYDFAKYCGEYNYLDPNCFNIYNPTSITKTDIIIDDIKSNIKYAEKNNEHCYNYVKHYKKKGEIIPIWVAFNAINFTTTSRFYENISTRLKLPSGEVINLRDVIRTHINSLHKNLASEADYINMFKILTQLRNLCAHGQRVYNFTTKSTISINNPVVRQLNDILSRRINYNNLNGVMLSLFHLMDNKDFFKFLNEYLGHIKTFLSQPIAFRSLKINEEHISLVTELMKQSMYIAN